MATELTSAIVKEYGINAGADVVGIAASKDFNSAPDEKIQSAMCGDCNKCVEACPAGSLNDLTSFGKKGCSKFLTIEDKKLKIKCFLCRTICPHRFGIKGTV